MYEPFFHVGVLVHDIDAAAKDFSRVLGLEFEPVRTAPVATGETMRYCYALNGAPYLELVQSTGTGIWAPEQGEGLHHIAFSVPDVGGVCAAFDDLADTVVSGAAARDEPRVIFTRPEALHGVRAEYLQSDMVAATLDRVRALAGG